MKKALRATAAASVLLLTVLMFAGNASAQSADCVAVGYSDECPRDVTPPDPGDPSGSGQLARTGSSSLPLAEIAIVLIGVGGVLTYGARRKREAELSA